MMIIYDVDFRWQGDIGIEQGRMLDWLDARGEEATGAFATDGTGGVSLSSIERICELQRDLGVTVVKVERVELEEEDESVTA
jgi:hypothetical protein